TRSLLEDTSETDIMDKHDATLSTYMLSADHSNLYMSTGLASSYGALQLSSSSDLPIDMRRRGKLPPRCVTKEGKCKFEARNVEQKSLRFLGDIFTSLLEVRWRWVLFFLCLVYFGSWSFFACGWYGILWIHGDFENFGVADWKPCITNISNFASAFLFSVETQHTTGYGFYHLGDECPTAIILLCIQSIVGVLLEGLLVGLVFVKMSRAKKRSATLIFSKYALICQRDGKLCFMFRVGDVRTNTHLLETHIRAQVIRKRTTLEGEVINFFQEELQISGNKEKSGKILLFWPTTVVHHIDSSSPLYDLCPSDLTCHNLNFEIIVVLEGIVESTGLTVQARSSYLPSEILWGYRFEELQTTKSVSSGERIIDYSLFHETFPVTTTTLSASELDLSIPKQET
ncbi:unnamed protein product, partial [Allacma fusca]